MPFVHHQKIIDNETALPPFPTLTCYSHSLFLITKLDGYNTPCQHARLQLIRATLFYTQYQIMTVKLTWNFARLVL